jgi:chromosome segregation ATPase
MTGDACGWEEIKDADGRRSYENANTGEVSDKKPEILVFAEIIRKIDGAADDKGKLAKLDKKLKEAETKKREADVKLNESRAETQNLRGLVKGWKESAEIVFFSLTGFDEDVSKMVDSLNGRAEYAVEKNELLAKTQQKAGDSLTRVSELRETLTQRESEVARLTGQVERLTKDMKKSQEGAQLAQSRRAGADRARGSAVARRACPVL